MSIVRFSGDWYFKNKPFQQELNPANPARYAIDYTNDVNPDDRKHWVAGSTIRIIDRQSNEIMAEKTVYVFETELGNLGTGRSPWNLAVRCPHELEHEQYTVLFVNKVLQPKQEK